MLEIIEIIWKFFLIISLILVILLLVLVKGINIDNIRAPNAKISGLYIKLDKKLIVTIDEVIILKPNEDIKQSTDGLSSLDVVLNKIPYLYIFFDTIEAKSIKYNNEEARLKYSDKNIFADSKYLTMQTKSIFYNNGNMELDFEKLLFKDYYISLSGKLNGMLHENIYSFDGRYDLYDVVGDLKLDFSNNILSYNANSDEFKYKSFENLMNNLTLHINLPEEAQSWIYKDIKADTYKLSSFSGKVDIKTFNIFPNEMKGVAEALDVNVTFHENLTAAKAQKADISFANDELVIMINNGTYKGAKLKNNSNVTISNIIDNDKLNIQVNLFSSELIDDRIIEIIKAYGIEAPVKQLSGKNDAYVGIFVNINPFNVDVKGDIQAYDSNLTIADIPFYSKYANVKLHNARLDFNSSNLQMHNLFDIDANASLYASDKILIANATINNFNLNANNTTIAKIQNLSTEALMFIIDDGVKFEIDDFDIALTFAKNSLFEFNSVEKIYEFIPLANEYGVKKGKVSISTEDFEDFYGLAYLYDIKDIPLKYNNETIDMFEGEFFISKDNVHAKSFNEFFDINMSDELNISIKDIDLVVTQDMISKEEKAKKTNNNQQIPINFASTNASIIVEPLNATIVSNSINVNVDKHGDIIANFHEDNGFIDVAKSDNNLNVYANDFTSSFVNNIINKEFFKGGKFNTYIEGNSTEHFNGVFSFTDSALKNFTLLNNLAAFINTIPALATLNDPRFSSNGYPIKNGFVEFARIEDFLYISNIFLEGYSTDVLGIGYVELDTKNIYMDLEISTLKALSSIIDFIPLVNYIILGEDGKITMRLAVRGTYDNPKIETNVIEGVAKSPFNVLKRVLLTPFRIFQ